MKILQRSIILLCIAFLGYNYLMPDVHSQPSEKSEIETAESSNIDAYADWITRNTDYVKPDKKELAKLLTNLQFNVTQEDATERPFKNEYWDNKQEGIYVDIVSGEPLFSSKDKYKSGTGWPSFTRPIHNDAILTKLDKSLFFTRTELRSRLADSHLGHIFDDGPAPTGLRYCINSASLRFIPKEKLDVEGYSEFISLFNEED